MIELKEKKVRIKKLLMTPAVSFVSGFSELEKRKRSHSLTNDIPTATTIML
jgi:hypothetical protein